MSDVLGSDGRVDEEKAEKHFVIQAAIWQVTDGEGLTTEIKKQLEDL